MTRFAVRNPADDSVVAEIEDGGAAQARAAVDAAAAAFPGWRARTARERADALRAWHAAILAQRDELASLVTQEAGKPIEESHAEITYGAAYVEWFAEEARRAYGDVIPAPVPGRQLFAVKEPVGIVAAVTPWNFPVAMLTRKIAPALAAGCTVVAKPSEETPLSALKLAELANDAGLGNGIVNVVAASRARAAEVVDAWLDDARVRKISFTGSTQVGKALARGSAETLKRLSLELGGNAPFLVFDDADLDAAVDGLCRAKFRNAGQTCIAPNRVLVDAKIHDAFVERLTAAVAKIPTVPLIHARAAMRVNALIDDAIARGARRLRGGRRDGNRIPPTLLTDVTQDMAVAKDEIFGPVLPLLRFTDEAQAIAMANATRAGLAAYLYARDHRRLWRVGAALETGMLGLNESAISTEVAPFGGVKESGYGREGSRHGLDDYQSIKYLCLGGLAHA